MKISNLTNFATLKLIYSILKVQIVLLCLSIFCLLSTPILAQSTKFPELNLVSYLYVAPDMTIGHRSGGPILYTVSIDLQLIEEKKQAFVEEFDKIEKFIKKFEEKRDELEAEYKGSSGEKKIEKAMKLILFILESEQEWDKFILPLTDKWEGEYSMDLNAYGFISLASKGLAKIDLLGMSVDPGKSSGISKLEGIIDGNLTVDMNLSVGDIDILEGGGSYSYSDKLEGNPNFSSLLITEQEFNQEGSMNLSFGFPGFFQLEASSETHDGQTTARATFISIIGYGEYYATDARLTGYTVLLNPYNGMYERKNINESIPQDNIHQILVFEYVDPKLLEEIDFQAYKNKYFNYYVKAIDDAGTKKYNGTNELADKEENAKSTFYKLLEANSYGNQIGVDDFIYVELGLIFKTQKSLYDKWFERWFNSSDKKWEKEIANSKNKEKRNNLKLRLFNALKFVEQGRLLASNEIMKTLGLFEQSAFLSARIREYFKFVNPQYCTELIEGENNIVTEYNDWWKNIYKLAITFGSQSVVSLIHSENCILMN